MLVVLTNLCARTKGEKKKLYIYILLQAIYLYIYKHSYILRICIFIIYKLYILFNTEYIIVYVENRRESVTIRTIRKKSLVSEDEIITPEL